MSITLVRTTDEPLISTKRTLAETFKLIETITLLVANQKYYAMTLSGKAGVGKTTTVLDTLKSAGYVDVDVYNAACTAEGEEEPAADAPEPKLYKYVKGETTPKGIYQTLQQHWDMLVIFDDCDSSFTNPTAANILKAATDDKRRRVISWNKHMPDGTDSSFSFIGSVIVITNKTKLPSAMHDRAIPIEVTLTPDEVLERIREIAAMPTYMPKYHDEEKNACIDFINENQHEGEFSLRVLSSALVAYREQPEHWQAIVLAKMRGG